MLLAHYTLYIPEAWGVGSCRGWPCEWWRPRRSGRKRQQGRQRQPPGRLLSTSIIMTLNSMNEWMNEWLTTDSLFIFYHSFGTNAFFTLIRYFLFIKNIRPQLSTVCQVLCPIKSFFHPKNCDKGSVNCEYQERYCSNFDGEIVKTN